GTATAPAPCAGKNVDVVLHGVAAPFPFSLKAKVGPKTLDATGHAEWLVYDQAAGPPYPVGVNPVIVAPMLFYTTASAIIWWPLRRSVRVAGFTPLPARRAS